MFDFCQNFQENLGGFIRKLVGLDRKAAMEAFSRYLDGKAFSAGQIQFVNSIIEHLTRSGSIPTNLLYERPFTDIHELGLDGIFSPKQSGELLHIIEALNASIYTSSAPNT